MSARRESRLHRPTLSRSSVRQLLYAVEPVEQRVLLATIVVNTATDALNYPSNVTVAQLGATISLRDALTAVSNTNTSNIINFSATVFPTTATKTITLNGTQLSVNNPQALTINGGNAVRVSGNNASRVLSVSGAGGVTINNMTFSEGNANAGAGIANNSSNLTLNGVQFAANVASGFGGALASPGGGTINISGSVFFNNSAGNEGAAIEQQGVAGSPATMTITNSTLYNNTANGSGFGAISNVATGAAASLAIQDCTIAGNTGSASFGGGILNAVNSGTAAVSYIGTIFSNTGPNIVNLGGTITSNGHNLSSDATGNLTGPGDMPNTNPKLGSLVTYGNRTAVLVLPPGSPAIDAGVAISGVTLDQRGDPRSQGAAPDIGAFESRPFTMSISAGNNQTGPVTLPGGTPTPFSILRVRVTGEALIGGTVSFTVVPSGGGAAATLSASTATLSGFSSDATAPITATPNAVAGTYTVVASAIGANSISFNLTNVVPIRLTSARVVTSSDVANPNPVIGEQIFVEAGWVTEALPAAAIYQIKYSVDGVAITPGDFTFGAGSPGVVNVGWYIGGWYASAGLHHVVVSVDAPTISTSSFSFDFSAASATDLPAKFVLPIGGSPFQSWGIVNYVDTDPTGGVKDYNGGNFTYNGHAGHDITLSNFSTMDDGVPDYAAAAGTVSAVGEGNYDRNTTPPFADANYVVIDHGAGWQTIYYHLRTNSIIVRVGDHVVAGQTIGLAGSSGFSSAAHLHFEVHHNGNVVEPQMDQNTFWLNPLPYMGTLSSAMETGITSSFAIGSADLNAEERPASADVFRQVAGQQLLFWVNPNTKANTPVDFIFYRPDGTISTALSGSFVAGEQRGGWVGRSINLASNLQLGTWLVVTKMNGVQVARDTFQVTTTGASAARVSQGSTYVPNNRSTPIDFGSVAPAAAAPQLAFTINNLGSAPLSLSNLVLPAGYSLVGALPASIAVGASAAITLQLSTAASGLYTGVVSMTTNDPHATTYRFRVKGRVTGGNTGAVHGQVYRDAAQNGYADGADFGMEGWLVSLLNPGTSAVLATTTTSFNGLYSFNNLANAAYRVRVAPKPGWTQTSANPADVTVAAGADVLASPVGVFGSLVVSTLADEDNGTADPFVGGGMSLREALDFANASATPPTIAFDPALTSSGPATITLTGGELEILRGLTINGPGANLLTINANHASRVVYAAAPAAADAVSISGLTLAGGLTPTGGGGVMNIATTLNLHAVVLNGNSAGVYGGGLASAQGGAIVITNSTISNNTAGSEGGGIIVQSSSGAAASLLLTNSTIAGNAAGSNGYGGAISGVAVGGITTITIQDSTLAANSGAETGGVDSFVTSGSVTVTYINSVFANIGPNFFNFGGSITSLGHNLSSDATGNLNAAGDLPNTNPMLGALADNGGPTPTMLPLPGSPLINAGVAVAGITADQRGILRPQGSAPDIGAVERAATAATALGASFEYDTRLAVTFTMSADASVTVSRSSIQLIDLATNLPVNVGTVGFNSDGTQVTLLLNNALPDGNYKATLGGISQTFYVLRGDFNRDHTVNFADLVVLAQHYELTGQTLTTGDTNYDGVVNFADLVTLAQNYGQSLVTIETKAAPVPGKTTRGKDVAGDVLA